jgi:hypothetical protein
MQDRYNLGVLQQQYEWSFACSPILLNRKVSPLTRLIFPKTSFATNISGLRPSISSLNSKLYLVEVGLQIIKIQINRKEHKDAKG